MTFCTGLLGRINYPPLFYADYSTAALETLFVAAQNNLSAIHPLLLGTGLFEHASLGVVLHLH